MIVCGQCGARNENEAFCGECGAFLEWEGEKVEPEPARVLYAEPVAAEQPGLVERARTAIGIGAEERHADKAESLPPPIVTEPVAATPAAPAPAPVRPGVAAPKVPRRSVPLDDRRPAPGEIVCGACGAGNVPTRKFCRRCGADLVDAPVVKNPWWRRIFTRTHAPGPVAGTRPERVTRKKLPSRPVLFAILVAVLAVAAYVQRGPLRNVADTVLDRVKGTQLVNPKAITASDAAPGHPAELARDGATNRFWAPGKAGDGKGSFVQASFDKPFRLVYLRVFNGSSGELAPYLTQARPHSVRVTVIRSSGKQTVKVIQLKDQPGKQEFHIAVSDASSVRLTIESAYGATAGRLVALAEVEFLGRG